MKKCLTFSMFLFLTLNSFSQQARVNEILAFKEIKILKYNPQVFNGMTLVLDMNFGSPTILNPSKIKILNAATIINVDVVYSDYPKEEDFPQLTQKRIENLLKLNPKLLSAKDFKWRLLRQTSCVDELSARELFHGIVITYRPGQTKEMAEKEVNYVKELLSGSRVSEGFAAGDSVVDVVLKRNKWDNMAIVADLTGSMSPYSAQLLLWLKLNTDKNLVKQYVFFNDGDRKAERDKIIGRIGGGYETRSAKFKDVENLIYNTMRNGSGGDLPENNIEAILKATELCPDCKNIVMIADNMASMKDIVLINHVKKPVKIILCGVFYGINTEYLDLARATGGSVHTIEQDLTDIVKMKEGEEIKINRQTYKIINGKFIRVSKA